MSKELSVFDSTQPQHQDRPETRKNRFGRLNISGKNFDYTQTQDDAPLNLIEKLKPSEIKGDDSNYWNEKSISNSDFINIYQAVYFIYMISKGVVIFLFPVFLLVSFLPIFGGHSLMDTVYGIAELVAWSVCYVLLPGGGGGG
ncbi:hypothetical protein [Vibrio penaeicida]|uniref:Uncharacterized protein n=1 Tax=Vibrio penaeicida TaxID=104609 RepID=A0AAV5NUD7_9VIBR|nr:hypothetical protein [Vibrio penaeicida]RTZ23275.1 hypothetical protein EKN09_09705 [Vibrio penaeicida]GLQ74128.1 hypothetical protein GCM10007932_34890 [Vibrio penaeicida]